MFKEEREIWKDIKDCEGLYQVSNLGRVRSLERIDASGHHRKGIMLAGGLCGGYRSIILYRDGGAESKLIHRLVAEAFIPNPDGLPEVNHLDEDKMNNAVSNLEYCTRQYNLAYGTRNERIAKSQEQTIHVVTSSGHRYYFGSVKEAAKLLGLWPQDITNCLHGRAKHHGGFSFERAVKPCQA
ncbi:endonuclease [Lacticaseibacillus paracasei]|uniref:NUMOD4 domain-containing protein n=1 Tax=Lacticaseibacillus paracasei TaxID=1597 RepID=UPI000E09A518|nr:NUMOD4 domain-containing protein [Lacticaseibacillus paracasei]RDF91113.1 endonuclease [Lacticaseibacillus paracasei]